MVELVTSQYRLDPQTSYPLQILATKYSIGSSEENLHGYTLIFMHAVGMHKESWEVVIKRLFELAISGGRSLNIRDAFSIESPNHGQSAVVNEDAIRERFGDSWPTRATAEAAHAFLSADPSQGANIDFFQRKLIGIGHSMGAAALFLLRELSPRVQFESVIAIEPGISLKNDPETLVTSQMLTAWTWLRPDVWSSRSSAKKQLAQLPVYQSWDPRALDLYVKYALRTHPAKKYNPPFSFDGVTTAITKEQEAACFRSDHLVVDALKAYSTATREIPVHVVWGNIHDVATPGLKALLSDTKEGRTPVSVSFVDDAGHLVIQQKPDQVADILYSILLNSSSSISKYRL